MRIMRARFLTAREGRYKGIREVKEKPNMNTMVLDQSW